MRVPFEACIGELQRCVTRIVGRSLSVAKLAFGASSFDTALSIK